MSENMDTDIKSNVKEEHKEAENALLVSPHPERPKILVQRVFHQPQKNVLEQKLDYVIADSQDDIMHHVYGGLFQKKIYRYQPQNYCKKHDPNLFEYNDETLVKLGDKFDSLESFRLYVDGNAKHWKYYIKCSDSHRKNGKESFVFRCVFAKRKYTYFQAKGLRKRAEPEMLSDCPCRVILKPIPFGAKDLTVIYVCNHHDHPLTDAHFSKLQHGRRIHPSTKAELMDLLSLDVDRAIVKKYFELLTGYQMSDGYFFNVFNKMKKNNIARNFSVEQLKEMHKKIEKIKEEMGIGGKEDEENVDNDLISEDFSKKDKASQVAEVLTVLKSVAAPKKTPKHRQKNRQGNPELGTSSDRKRPRKHKYLRDSPVLSEQPKVNSQSRLETRLQELKHDKETLQSIKNLQNSVRCEAEKNPWAHDEISSSNSNPGGNVLRCTNKSQQEIASSELPTKMQTLIIENIDNDNCLGNQEIIYENEITVVENPDSQLDNTINNNTSYCIQYKDENDGADQNQQIILMLDDVESFNNLPEVQIQATELATVSIVSNNRQSEIDNADVSKDIQGSSNVTEVQNDRIESEIHLIAVKSDEVSAETPFPIPADVTQSIDETTVFEVIQTNDQNILPKQEVLRLKNNNENKKITGRKAKHNKRDLNYTNGNAETSLKVKSCSKHKSRKGSQGDFTPQDFKDNSSMDWLENHFDSENPTDCLEDDDCYVIIVDNEVKKDVITDDEGSTHDYQVSFKGEIDDGLETYHSFEKGFANERSSDVQCTIHSASEIFEYKTKVACLKRQKLSLEMDIERLQANKRRLMKTIKQARSFRKRMKDQL